MSPDEWLQLADRCEQATGPDPEIDDAIAALIGLRVVYVGHPIGRCWYDRDGHAYPIHRYTGSRDAIAELTDREFPGASCLFLSVPNGMNYARIDPSMKGLRGAIGKTEALARCAAHCFAMSAKRGDAGEAQP